MAAGGRRQGHVDASGLADGVLDEEGRVVEGRKLGCVEDNRRATVTWKVRETELPVSAASAVYVTVTGPVVAAWGVPPDHPVVAPGLVRPAGRPAAV